MNVKDLYSLLNEYAPIKLSDDLCKIDGGYDNSGIIIDGDRETDKILFCLDLTREAVEYAIKNGVGIIVTHHPAIYRPIKNIKANSPLLACASANICVISMHLNFDCASKGIDYYLAEGLGGKPVKILTPLGDGVGYGRVSEVDATAGEILERYKRNFQTEKVILYGEKDKNISKIASFCGAGLGEDEVYASIEEGVDMVVSADISHHTLLTAVQNGLCILSCTHYSSENYGMKKIAEHFGKILNEKIYFFGNDKLV